MINFLKRLKPKETDEDIIKKLNSKPYPIRDVNNIVVGYTIITSVLAVEGHAAFLIGLEGSKPSVLISIAMAKRLSTISFE